MKLYATKSKNLMSTPRSYTRLYGVWQSMKSRCSNPNVEGFKNYGGRGIQVCAEWLDYEVFRAWAIEAGYRKGLTIERKDNDGDYCPANCKWIPKEKQSKSTRLVKHTNLLDSITNR